MPSFSRQAQARSFLANLGRYSGLVSGEYSHVRKMPLEAHARFHYTQGPSLALPKFKSASVPWINLYWGHLFGAVYIHFISPGIPKLFLGPIIAHPKKREKIGSSVTELQYVRTLWHCYLIMKPLLSDTSTSPPVNTAREAGASPFSYPEIF